MLQDLRSAKDMVHSLKVAKIGSENLVLNYLGFKLLKLYTGILKWFYFVLK